VGGQNAASVQPGQQLLHGQQGVNFGGREPQAGQFVRVKVRRVGGCELVATKVAAVDDGVVQAFTKVLQVALEGGARHLQLGQQTGKANDLAGAQQFADFVKPFCAVHGISRVDTVSLFSIRRSQIFPIWHHADCVPICTLS
jgi:hypothetical protein